jgi:hypothetical protein
MHPVPFRQSPFSFGDRVSARHEVATGFFLRQYLTSLSNRLTNLDADRIFLLAPPSGSRDRDVNVQSFTPGSQKQVVM